MVLFKQGAFRSCILDVNVNTTGTTIDEKETVREKQAFEASK